MADDPDKKDPDDKKPPPDPEDGKKPDLGDAGKKALDAERAARKKAEKDLADTQARLKEIEDKDKSESDKLRDEVAALKKDRDDHAARVLRMEVAAAKGLTPAQAKRLVGATKEELEADADELVADFAPSDDDKKPPPGGRPKERLRGGGDPTEEPEENDPRKLAAQISRF